VSKLYVTEFAGMLPSGVPSGPPLVDQTPITIGSAANQSLAFGVNTHAVRLHSDVICSYNVNGAQATTNSARMAANQTEYVAVQACGIVSVIANT
jgi:hypothetical protein